MALRILNYLYGSDILSSNELAKGYTRPGNSSSFPVKISTEIFEARNALQAKRNLNLILHSKSTYDTPVSAGDFVKIYIKQQHKKRGSWSAPKPALSINSSSQTVTVPDETESNINAAVEEVWHAMTCNDFAISVQDAIDQLSIHLYYTRNDLPDDDGENGSDNSPSDLHRDDELSMRMTTQLLPSQIHLRVIKLRYIGQKTSNFTVVNSQKLQALRPSNFRSPMMAATMKL